MASSFVVSDRPMALLGIADGALAIMRHRPRVVLGLVATFVLPVQLLTSWLQRGAFADLSFDTLNDLNEDDPFAGSTDLGLYSGDPLVIVLPFVVLPFLGVALTHLVMGWHEGRDRTFGECLRFTLARTHVILAAFVVSKIVQVLTLMILTPATMLVAPVIAAEGLGPIAAMRRAWRVARPRFGRLIGLLLLLMLLNLVLGAALGLLPTLAGFIFGGWGWVAFFALNTVATAVLNVLGVGAAVLAYLDTRNRVEGLDLLRRVRGMREPGGAGVR